MSKVCISFQATIITENLTLISSCFGYPLLSFSLLSFIFLACLSLHIYFSEVHSHSVSSQSWVLLLAFKFRIQEQLSRWVSNFANNHVSISKLEHLICTKEGYFPKSGGLLFVCKLVSSDGSFKAVCAISRNSVALSKLYSVLITHESNTLVIPETPLYCSEGL